MGKKKTYLQKKIQYLIEFFFLFYLYQIARLMSYKFIVQTGRILGFIVSFFAPGLRRRVLNNLKGSKLEMNKKQAIKFYRRVLVNLGMAFMEFFYLPRIDEKFLKKYIKFSGKEELDKALEKRKGIIIVTGHNDNWELLGAILVKSGYKLAALYHPLRNPYSDKLFYKIRSKAGIELISMKNYLIPSFKALKENKLLGLIADQDAGDDGIFVDFMGKPASTSKGPAAFALKTKAPMVFLLLVRERKFYHRLYVKQLQIKETGDYKKDVYINTKLWSDELEKWVLKYPEQWMWTHRKWHTKIKKSL